MHALHAQKASNACLSIEKCHMTLYECVLILHTSIEMFSAVFFHHPIIQPHTGLRRWRSVSKTTACYGARGRIWRNQQVRVRAGKAHSSPSHTDVSPQRAKQSVQMERKCQQCLQTTSPLLAADKTSTITSTILCVHVVFFFLIFVSIWFEPTYASV